jgi:hypothetical protein
MLVTVITERHLRLSGILLAWICFGAPSLGSGRGVSATGGHLERGTARDLPGTFSITSGLPVPSPLSGPSGSRKTHGQAKSPSISGQATPLAAPAQATRSTPSRQTKPPAPTTQTKPPAAEETRNAAPTTGLSSKASTDIGSGPCPVSSEGPCVISLHGKGAPAASASCTSSKWSKFLSFREPGKWSDSDGDGWWESVISLAVDPTKECGCARFRIHFEAPVRNFTLNIGNSDTNDGYGGDQGTSGGWTSEVYLFHGILTVQSNALGGILHDPLLSLDPSSLSGGWLQIEVCDESIGFELAPEVARGGVRRWKMESPNHQMLFGLAPRADGKQNALYAAFNRVIWSVDGKPAHGRAGTGVSRVEIWLSP